MKYNKKLISCMMLFVLVMLTIVPAVQAKDNDIMSVQIGTRDLTKKQIEELLKDPEKVKERSKLDVKNLLDQAESEMNQASSNYSKELKNRNKDITVLSSDVYIGTDASFGFSDTGNQGETKTGIADAITRWGSYYSDSNKQLIQE